MEVAATDADCLGNEPLYDGDKIVGLTTSGAYGHATGKSLTFAYVEPGLATVGKELDILLFGERVKATILAEPAYDPKNEKMRA